MIDARPWTAAALIGALWGALELSVGTALHLSRLPVRGMVMAALGLVCLVTLRRLRGRPGACLLAGAIAAFLKVFTLGGLYPGPLIGILLEALVVEVVFDIFGSRRVSAVVGGAVVLGLTPVQMTLTVWVVAGRDTVEATARAALEVLAWLGFPVFPPVAVLGGVVAVAAGIGALAGWWAWSVSSGVNERLGQ
ncbi:MAG: hypothetical protein ABFS37_14130 [Acidobacteriota bacterium]